MNPDSCKTYNENTETARADRSPIEGGLERLHDAQERVEKAFFVLAERLAPVTQPEDPNAVPTNVEGGHPR